MRFLWLVLSLSSAGAATTVNWNNSAESMLLDLNGVPLSSGSPSVAYDGTILSLGYYSQSTTLDPFAGNWIQLDFGSIGEKSAVFLGDGVFSYTSIFEFTSLPAGTPLTIRFYDSTSIATSGHFNAVSNTSGTWAWQDDAEIDLSFSSQTLVWQGGAGSAFRTTIAIPEPGTGLMLAAFASCVMLGRRRRARSIIQVQRG